MESSVVMKAMLELIALEEIDNVIFSWNYYVSLILYISWNYLARRRV